MRANIGPGIGAQHGEGQPRRTSDKSIRETSVGMFIDLGVWPIMFDGVAKTVEGPTPGLPPQEKINFRAQPAPISWSHIRSGVNRTRVRSRRRCRIICGLRRKG